MRLQRGLLPLAMLMAATCAFAQAYQEVTGVTPTKVYEFDPSKPFEILGTTALTTSYSNLQTYLTRAITQGPAATIAGNAFTRLMADDITLAVGSASARLGRLQWTTYNGNAVAVSARMRMRFWRNDPVTNLPGIYYATGSPTPAALGVTFSATSLAANTATVWRWDLGNSSGFQTWLSANAGETIWIGLTFDNNTGATGATETQIGNLGQLLYGPPSVGTTPDGVFITTIAGNFFAPNAPAGQRFFWDPNANPPPATNLGFAWNEGVRIRIFGRVDFGQDALVADGKSVTVQLRAAGADPSTPALDEWTGILANGGRFDYDAGAGVLLNASYDLYVKSPRHLREKFIGTLAIDNFGVGGAPVDGAGAPTTLVTLDRNGDIVENNVIDIDDFLAMAGTYELDSTDPSYNSAADLNDTGAIDIDDFLIMARSYDQTGMGGPF